MRNHFMDVSAAGNGGAGYCFVNTDRDDSIW